MRICAIDRQALRFGETSLALVVDADGYSKRQVARFCERHGEQVLRALRTLVEEPIMSVREAAEEATRHGR